MWGEVFFLEFIDSKNTDTALEYFGFMGWQNALLFLSWYFLFYFLDEYKYLLQISTVKKKSTSPIDSFYLVCACLHEPDLLQTPLYTPSVTVFTIMVFRNTITENTMNILAVFPKQSRWDWFEYQRGKRSQDQS